MNADHQMDKGGQMEESLRDYFLEMGYFVVRGAKYSFQNVDITDIDLWLYQRPSSFSRQRFNVDIKNKRIPQAFGRILWAKGISESLKFDGALVATTDSRPETRNFGEKCGVVVLDGTLLAKIKKRYTGNNRRISQEELSSIARKNKSDRTGSEWIDRIEHGRSRVLTQLNFDGCNSLLHHIAFFAEESIVAGHRSEVACRFLYETIALFLITVDFIIKDYTFIEKPIQSTLLNEGFCFGTLGRQGAEQIFSTASKIAATYSQSAIKSSEILKRFQQDALDLPTGIIAEFVLRANHGSNLFDLALSFDGLAYAASFTEPAELSSDHRALIGAILDFSQIDRKSFFDKKSNIISESEPINSESLDESEPELPM